MRCRYGRPQVIVSAPLRVNGKTVDELPDESQIRSVSIFPTLYWLSCPMLKAAVGRLESAGWVGRLKKELQGDPQAVAGLREAHERTARIRSSLLPESTKQRLEQAYPGQYRVLTESGVAGMRDEGDALGVKCLHAHLADYLAEGQNPVGQRVWALLTAGGVDPRGSSSCFQEREAACPGDSQSDGQPQAAIDVGSNSVRLLVARWTADGRWERLAANLLTTRLGAGVAENGALTPESIDQTVNALKTLRDQAARLGVQDPIAIGTSALREATNRDELLIRAWEEARVSVRVISGDEEGALSLRGALTAVRVAPQDPVVLCDVGGGSTEIIIGDGAGTIYTSASLPFGAVRLYNAKDHGSTIENALNSLREELEVLVQRVAPDVRFGGKRATLVGVGGTATTLAALDLQMTDYEPDRINGYSLPIERVRYWLDALFQMDVVDRAKLPGMPAGRADIMPFGLAIIGEVIHAWRNWSHTTLVVSDNDLLQGVLM